MKKTMHHDIYIGGILLALSTFFLVLTGSFPKQSAYFPRFFTCLLIVLSAVIIWEGIRKTAKLHKGMTAESGENPITLREIALPMSGFAMIVFYVAAIPIIGFFVATGIFLLTSMWLLKIRSILMILLSTVGVEAFIYFLFIVQLKLSMPSGLLI